LIDFTTLESNQILSKQLELDGELNSSSSFIISLEYDGLNLFIYDLRLSNRYQKYFFILFYFKTHIVDHMPYETFLF